MYGPVDKFKVGRQGGAAECDERMGYWHSDCIPRAIMVSRRARRCYETWLDWTNRAATEKTVCFPGGESTPLALKAMKGAVM